MSGQTAILILAAGSATRMGKPKQMLPFKGTTLLGQVVKVSNQLHLGPPYVVLGAHAEEIERCHAPGKAHWIVNPAWEQGMGASLVYGLKALLKKKPSLTSVMILLADQPLISAAYLRVMIQAFQSNKVALVATKYPEGPGVPVLIGKSLFQEFLGLTGDQGARKILCRHIHEALLLDNETGVFDIDSPEDYQDLRSLE